MTESHTNMSRVAQHVPDDQLQDTNSQILERLQILTTHLPATAPSLGLKN